MSALRQKQYYLPPLHKTEDPSGAGTTIHRVHETPDGRHERHEDPPPMDPPARNPRTVARNRYVLGGDRAPSPSSSTDAMTMAAFSSQPAQQGKKKRAAPSSSSATKKGGNKGGGHKKNDLSGINAPIFLRVSLLRA